MEWDAFAKNLQTTFPHITDRCFLIVSSSDTSKYIQFAANSTTLTIEAADSDAANAPDMLRAGWNAPLPTEHNWSRKLMLPALSSEYAVLAAQCVTVLRDTHLLESPSNLYYEAWREPEHQPNDITWQPEQMRRLDVGENQLRLPSLGIALKN